MHNKSKYCVLPLNPKLQAISSVDEISLDEFEKKSTENLSIGLGCFLWGTICILVYLLSGSVLIGIAAAAIIVTTIAVTIRNSSISKLKRKKSEAARQCIEQVNQSEIRRVEYEARSLTSYLTRTHKSSVALAAELSQHLDQAFESLKDAKAEYQKNDFFSFWYAVEEAATHLTEINNKARQLSKNANEYYRLLNGRTHTFPPFPVDLNTIPDASDEIEELRCIIHTGQTNFQFANTWEHRRTQNFLLAGFRTLSEMVNNLDMTMEKSISTLHRSLSSRLAREVKEQIRIHESQDKQPSKRQLASVMV